MSARQHQQKALLAMIPTSEETGKQPHDSSGYAMFSAGEAGDMHVMAHRMLDEDRTELGHQLLGTWLNGRTGSGSQRIHLQWHMAVFDLSLGHWQAALERFRQHILPAVNDSFDALTDAPALLWRIYLASGKRAALPWAPVRIRALAAMKLPCTPFVEIHSLLALAGAGDLEALDRRMERRPAHQHSRNETFVLRTAAAIRSYVVGDYETAAAAFDNVIPRLPQVGGSRAQNEFFSQLQESARSMASAGISLTQYRKAA